MAKARKSEEAKEEEAEAIQRKPYPMVQRSDLLYTAVAVREFWFCVGCQIVQNWSCLALGRASGRIISCLATTCRCSRLKLGAADLRAP